MILEACLDPKKGERWKTGKYKEWQHYLKCVLSATLLKVLTKQRDRSSCSHYTCKINALLCLHLQFGWSYYTRKGRSVWCLESCELGGVGKNDMNRVVVIHKSKWSIACIKINRNGKMFKLIRCILLRDKYFQKLWGQPRRRGRGKSTADPCQHLRRSTQNFHQKALPNDKSEADRFAHSDCNDHLMPLGCFSY